MAKLYRMKPDEFVTLWQLRGVKASILDKSLVHGDTWVELDRVTKTLAGFYGHVGSKHIAVGGYSTAAIYTPVIPSSDDVDFSLLDNPLADYPAAQAVLDFLNGNVTDSDVTLHNLNFVSYHQPDIAQLLASIGEEISRGSDNSDKYVKLTAIKQALDLATNLATGAYQDAIEGLEELNLTIERLARLIKGDK